MAKKAAKASTARALKAAATKKKKVVSAIKNAVNKNSVAPSANWDLYRDGVSYSLLSRFINCRERFRLYAVEGLRPEKSGRDALEFGTYVHRILELHAKKPNLSIHALVKANPCPLDPALKPVAQVVMDRYLWWYKNSKYRYIAQEEVFDVPYLLPNGRTLRLRGRFDEILRAPAGYPRGTIWIQENKTKEKINTYQIESFLPNNLQTMFYSTAAERHYSRPVTGVVYNVIRKPTHKRSVQKKETQEQFLERLDGIIEADPKHFFHRVEFPFHKSHLERWQLRTLNPILLDLCRWWESIAHNPFEPWTLPDGSANPNHFLRPFGVYDSLTTGIGDYFDPITRNNYVGYSRDNEPFSELRD